jgi:hypothetical protein
VKVGLGWNSTDPEIVREHARYFFLDAAVKFCPDVFESLRDEPYRAYLRSHDPEVDKADMALIEEEEASFRCWTERWNLTVPWCFQWVNRSFDCWASEVDPKEWPWPRIFDLMREAGAAEEDVAAPLQDDSAGTDIEPFRWLAEYQVARRGFEEIWRSLPKEERQLLKTDSAHCVEELIKQWASYIGLTLRR